MNVLIIGGTGVLSSAVTSEALKKGYSITMINRGNHEILEGVNLIKSSKNDLDYIKLHIQGKHFDAVADFLCYTPEETKKSYLFYSKYADQYLYISSMAVYDKTVEGPLTEDHAKGLKIWKYSTDKWASEVMINELAKNNCCKVTIIRPGLTYGNTRIPFDIAPAYGHHWTFVARAKAGKPIILTDGGSHALAAQRVEDFAVAFVGLMGNQKSFGEAFNICGDESKTCKEIIDYIGKYIGEEVTTIDIPKEWYAKEIPQRSGELLGGRCMSAKCSPEEKTKTNKKIKEYVPYFKNTISIEDGIRMTLDAYKADNYQYGIDWRFDAETDRLIKKWCKQNKLSYNQYNLHYIDYLGTAKLADRLEYWLEYHKNWLVVKIYKYCSNFFSRVRRFVLRCFKSVFAHPSK